MKLLPGRTVALAGCASIAVCAGVLSAGSALAATTPIYKCLDQNRQVLYTDERCSNGAELDVRAGDADPAAIARLDRARDALDQSAARRIAALDRPAVLVERSPREDNAALDESYAGVPAYASVDGFVPQSIKHRRPFQHRPPEPKHVRSFVPQVQHIAGRR
jgi:hypothetical protein